MRFLGMAVAATLAVVFAAALEAAPTPEQRAEIGALGTLLTRAGNLYTAQKYAEAGEIIKEVQERLDKLASGGDAQLVRQLEALHKRLVRAHALLELEGVTLPALAALPSPDQSGDKPGAASGPATVSFVRQVAPILNSRCGNCHVRNARGMFSMASYESLMKGPPSGRVVFGGNVAGSDLIVKVEDKEMPPNGSGIPDAELATLKKWVEEGARFDGPDPTAQLATLVPGGQPTRPMVAVEQATGNETVSFAREIAPVLAESCTGCHGRMNPRNNFSLATFEQLLRGGDTGEPVLPGRPADSLLIKKLKGTAADGARMPLNQPPLADETIAKIEKWIEEGAKFDAPNARQALAEVAAIAKAEASSHEELSADRALLAAGNWRRGMPGTESIQNETTNFLVIGGGRIGENTLADVAQRAEAIARKVAESLKAPRDQPLVKGRMTLFVFGDRYDYGEFGKMVERRDLPPAWRGHWGYTIVDAYGAVLVPRTDDYSLDALLAQQLASVHVASLGRGVPRWFAEGAGRVVASRFAPGSDQRVRGWDERLSGVFAAMSAPDDLLTGKLAPEDADIASYSFVQFLMADSRKFGALLDDLRAGSEFDKAFADNYGGTPAQAAAAWVRKPPKVRRR